MPASRFANTRELRSPSVAVSTDLYRLFQRRLLVVAGKGGVGKTTVACMLALIGAQLGKRTLLAEVDGAGRAAYLLGVQPAPVGEARLVQESLSVMSVEGTAALAEYLTMVMPVKRVLHAVFASRIYQYFVAAAPGLKELLTIGKIWYEAERVDEASGRRRWDMVVMDAPATGHSLQYLRMPRAARAAFGAGLVRRESQRLIGLLTDAQRTAVNLVTTEEEMPVNETLEMYQQLRDDLQMPLGLLFINRLHRAEFNTTALDCLDRRLAARRNPARRALLGEVLERGREERGWTEINRTYLARLSADIDLPRVELPFVFAEEFGTEQVRGLAAEVSGELASAARHGGSSRGRA
jgi:anion-transporting  ArsA/GET3 family ATPase